MNILFLLKSFDVGGVEVVTSVLANKFAKEGHHVVLWAFFRHEPTLESRLRPDVRIVYGNGFKVSASNVASLLATLDEFDISVIINQWALPPQPAQLLKRVLERHPTKVISVYHSDPMTNGRLTSIDTVLMQSKNQAIRLALRAKRKLYKAITSYFMRRCYEMSDVFVVLSESYKQHFVDFTGIENPNHLITIANPITIERADAVFDDTPKENRILYVGRLENENKKPERVLRIWKNIQDKFPDWHVDMVGDGTDMERLQQQAKEWGLNRVHFFGYQPPASFYKRASVLLLTSEFEGFPLVLTEAMSFGVVPLVYGSFSAAKDVIEHGYSGLISEPSEVGFSEVVMSEHLSKLLNDKEQLSTMSRNARIKSRQFSIDSISALWSETLRNVNRGG